MGSWDGAELCELIRLFLLSQISHLNLIVGLYRDDGLAVTDLKPRQAELMKKKLCQIFKENGFNITIEVNVKSVNFLDVNLNLDTGIYKPDMKPNDTPLYVHSQSNHPPGILRNIPQSVNRRLSSISANEEVFKQACPPYQEALEKSGYDFQLKFSPIDQPEQKSRRRQRKITWFNPPYSKDVQTNIGEKFLKLVDKNFPPGHPLAKLINRNTIKISYRCMPNMKMAISRHNHKVQKAVEEQVQAEPGCNCNGRCGPCPLQGGCLVESVVYKATVEQQDSTVYTYTGMTCNTFKERFYGHRSTFENENHPNPTTLSTHVWDLKGKSKNYEVKWNIIDKAKDFNPATQ